MNHVKNPRRNEFLDRVRNWSEPRPEFLQRLRRLMFDSDAIDFSDDTITHIDRMPINQR